MGYLQDRIFLLSQEEYTKYRDRITKNGWWWLRTPKDDCVDPNAVCVVKPSGQVWEFGVASYNIHGSVRPALKMTAEEYESSEKLGDQLLLYGISWDVIDMDQKIVLATHPIATQRFDPETNDYGKSELRKFLLAWITEKEKK